MGNPNSNPKADALAETARINWKVRRPDYDRSFAYMVEINGHAYYLRDSLGVDAPAEVFERIATVPELLNKSECMRDMLITCSRFHHSKGVDILMGVIKSAYRTIVKFRPELASQDEGCPFYGGNTAEIEQAEAAQ